MENISRIEVNLTTFFDRFGNVLQIDHELEFLIDGEAPYPYGDIVDVQNLKESLTQSGRFFIFNCSCGHPECTGRTEGVEVTLDGELVIWEDLDYDKKWILNTETIIAQLRGIQGDITFYKKLLTRNGVKYDPFIL